MKKIFVHLGKKWYLIVILAIAIILQCYCQLMLPEYMGNIQNQIRSVDVNFNEIWRYGGYMIGLSAAVVCLAFIQFYSASTVSAYVGQKLRTEMFKKVNSISLSDYNQFGTATLITRTTNDVEQIKNFTLMALRILVMSPTMMIIAIIKTAQERPSLLLVLGVILPIIIIFLLIILYVTAPYFKKIQEKIDNVTIVLRENLTGVRVVRAYDQEVVESKKFSKANKDLVQTTVKVNRIMSFTNPFINILFNLCFIGIYGFGFYLLSRITSDDTLKMYTEIGELVTDITVVAQYSSQIMMSFLMFAMIFIMMPQALASARRVNEVLNIDSNKDKNTVYKDDSKYNEYKAKIEELYKNNCTNFINLVDKTSISELGALLTKCKCLISVDTGTMHLGLAVNVPTVCLFYISTQEHLNAWAPTKIYNCKVITKDFSINNILDETYKLLEGRL